MVVLLSEASSFTAREFITVLGRGGVRCDALSARRGVIGRFSRWCRRVIECPAPGADPVGYLGTVQALLATGEYEAFLATHEQAWLLAAGRGLLPRDAPIAVAPPAAFERVQSKVAFARLADELGVPQPRWWPTERRPADVSFPFWVKAAHGTAGRSVALVHDEDEERAAIATLSNGGREEVMGQESASGRYAQVQALFEHGRLVAAHTSEQAGTGAGGSSAARVSVDHPRAREHAATIGRHLDWHGGLTLDYFHLDGEPRIIECNPRTVEPGNAFAAGVDLPSLTIALSTGAPLPAQPVIGRAGVRTHSALALVIGAAERGGSRRQLLRTGYQALAHRGPYAHSTEMLTPVRRDPAGAIPLAVVMARLLADRASHARMARAAVATYAVTPEAIDTLRRHVGPAPDPPTPGCPQ